MLLVKNLTIPLVSLSALNYPQTLVFVFYLPGSRWYPAPGSWHTGRIKKDARHHIRFFYRYNEIVSLLNDISYRTE
jgi:hypothetical protein